MVDMPKYGGKKKLYVVVGGGGVVGSLSGQQLHKPIHITGSHHTQYMCPLSYLTMAPTYSQFPASLVLALYICPPPRLPVIMVAALFLSEIDCDLLCQYTFSANNLFEIVKALSTYKLFILKTYFHPGSSHTFFSSSICSILYIFI